MVVNIKIMVFWNVVPYRLADSYHSLEERTASTFNMYLKYISGSYTFFVHGTMFLAKRKM
jgi:hypothetical protein